MYRHFLYRYIDTSVQIRTDVSTFFYRYIDTSVQIRTDVSTTFRQQDLELQYLSTYRQKIMR